MKEKRPRNAGIKKRVKSEGLKKRTEVPAPGDGKAPRKRRSDAGIPRKPKPEADFRPVENQVEKPRKSFSIENTGSDRPKRSFTRDEGGSGRPKRTFTRDGGGSDRPKRTFNKEGGDSDRPKRSFNRDGAGSDRPKRTFTRDGGGSDRPKKTFNKEGGESDRPKRSFTRDGAGSDRPKRTFNKEGGDSDRPKRSFTRDGGGSDRPKRTFNKEGAGSDRPKRTFSREDSSSDKPKKSFTRDAGSSDRPKRPFSRDDGGHDRPKRNYDEGNNRGRSGKPSGRTQPKDDNLIRLNKYIADAGVCSRRDADDLISSGAVRINGVICTELGTKVQREDKVQVGEQTLSREKLRYILLNKPKGYITTLEDPQERDTVLALVANACKERIYPVGRLDRNTTGVLMFTNDGDLAKKLTHPSHNIRKTYHVVLEQNLKMEDLEKIENGIELEDGFLKVDAIDFVGKDKSKKELGIELHSGKNRIVRRIFEELGYNITKLDRVVFAGLTKKDLPRGKWRHLSEKEVGFLKML